MVMEWIKLESTNSLGGDFCRILYMDKNPNLVSVPAKEMLLDSDNADLPKNRRWTEYTIIRIEKDQCALVVDGDNILSSKGKAGDYLLQGEEDLSKVKIYYVRTNSRSSKVYDTHTPVIFPANDLEFGVQQDIRFRCSFYFKYRIKNSKTFIRYMAEEKQKRIMFNDLASELYSVFSVSFPNVLEQLAKDGVRYTEICANTERITELMSEKLKIAWENSRGIELKSFCVVTAEPNKTDEKTFLEKCEHAKKTDDISSQEFSEEFSELLKDLGKVAGETIDSFQTEMTSFFGEFAETLEKELGVTDEEDSDDNYDLDLENLLDNCSTNVMGKWECPELKQVITFSILDASIEMDGKEVWRGDWEEKQDENGATTVVCPTADSFEYYAYFNLITDSENEKEYLEGVLSDTGKEKQFVRFFKN